MKAYWDSSALIETLANESLMDQLKANGGITRTHTLTEVFSALTGRMHIRFTPNFAAQTVRSLVGHLDFVDLTHSEVLKGLDKAQTNGVRGGRVHDLMHALAAKKSGAAKLLTMDRNDFHGLVPGLIIEQV
jgi:hypothetical protein